MLAAFHFGSFLAGMAVMALLCIVMGVIASKS